MHEVVFTGWGHWAEYIDQLSTPISLGDIYEVQSMVFSLNDTDLRIFKDTQNYEHVNELVPAPYHVHCEFEDKKNLFLYGEYPHPAFTHKDGINEYTILINEAVDPSFQIEKSKHHALKPYVSHLSNHIDYDAKQDIVVGNNLIDLASLSKSIEKLYKMTSTESAKYILKKISNECPVFSSSYNNSFNRLTISDVKKFESHCYASDYESFEADSNLAMKAKDLHITKSAALNFFDLPYNTSFEQSKKPTNQNGNYDNDDKGTELTSTTREKMLTLIIGMAIDGYQYKHKSNRNEFTGDGRNSLTARLQLLELDVDADTIRSYLKEAIQYLPLKDQ
jgi:hypothetical protein